MMDQLPNPPEALFSRLFRNSLATRPAIAGALYGAGAGSRDQCWLAHLGAGYFILAAYVPLLFITHGLAFRIPLRTKVFVPK
jgi:hypothetical protein